MCRIVYQIDNSYTYGKTSFFFNEIIIDAIDIKISYSYKNVWLCEVAKSLWNTGLYVHERVYKTNYLINFDAL